MAQPERYDAVVIGDGQAGGPFSTSLVKAGRRVAVVEREYAGGTCVNVGCTPTKTMIASARVAHVTRRAREYGVQTVPGDVDMVRVRQRKRDMVEMFRNGSRQAVESGGVDFIMGDARFTGPHSIEVALNAGGSRVLYADLVLIDVGTRPAIPPIDGLDRVPYLTSTSIMELDRVPEHLLILGGGYIALEFGQMFRRFGSTVTIVEQLERLMPREDADMADAILALMREDGVEILLGSTAIRVEGETGSSIRLVAKSNNGERTITGSHLLVAVGRTPNTDGLNLDAASVQYNEKGYIEVDERLATSAPGIYAAGEVAGTPAFTHMAYDDFRILRANLLEDGNRNTRDRLVPYTMFIDPQYARIGLGEDEARQQGRQVAVATLPMTSVARALEVDETRGMVKAVVDPETGHILGASVLAMEGGEIMAMLEVAMMGKVHYSTLRDGIFAHPTLAELMSGLLEGIRI